jgi:hypothetical protein
MAIAFLEDAMISEQSIKPAIFEEYNPLYNGF